MKRRTQWIAVLMTIAISCNGCSMLAVQKTKERKEVKKTEREDIDRASGKPWIDSDLEDAVTKDMKTDLKDDYAAAVNKKWLLKTKLEEDEYSTSNYDDISNQTTERLNKIITQKKYADNEDVKNMQNCYELWRDWKGRNKLGVEPVMPVVDKLKKVKTLKELSAFLTLPSEKRDGITLMSYSVSASFNDASKKIIWIGPRELSLGDSAEYKEMSETAKLTKKASGKLNRKLLKKVGFDAKEAKKMEENVYRFEKMIAPSIMTSIEQKSPNSAQKQNHPISKEELEKVQGEIPITKMMLMEGYQESDMQEMNLIMPDWLEQLKQMYTEEHTEMIRDYLLTTYLKKNAAYLDRQCYEWTMDESNEIEGTSGYGEDKEAACGAVQNLLGEQLAKAYSEIYVTKQDKDILTELTKDIINEYRDMLKEEEFLSDSTQAYALEKLDHIKVNILYPENWPDYANVKLKSKSEGGTYWKAVKDVEKLQKEGRLKSLNGENENTDWSEGVLTTDVNCYNNIMENSINILAGWCQGKNYNKDMSKEELYANIGYVIGHEISHAFDSKGAQFDKNGTLHNWWEEKDLEEFRKKNDKMAEYYSSISPWEGVNLQGTIMTGEAGADMTGIKCMLRMAEKIPNFNYDKFFRSYAECNRIYCTLEYQESILEDEHPLGYVRTNTVLQQFDKFLEVYDIKEGDGMYLAPEDRVIIW